MYPRLLWLRSTGFSHEPRWELTSARRCCNTEPGRTPMDERHIVLVDRKSHLPSTVTARELLEMGYRRRKTFAWCFAAIFLGAIVVAAVMPKRYESELKILVHRERADPLVTAQQTAAMAQNLPSLTEEDINSEVALL